jgi:hypothetical protein
MLLTWGDFPTIWISACFLGPFAFVVYSYGGGSAHIPSMVVAFGNGYAIALTLAVALGFMAMFAVPMTGFWLVKKRFRKAALMLSRALYLLADASVSRSSLHCLIKEANVELSAAQKLLPLTQAELFLCNISGYQVRLEFLSTMKLLVEELHRRPPVDRLLIPALQSHSAFLVQACAPNVKSVSNLQATLVAPTLCNDHAAGVVGSLHLLCLSFNVSGPYWTWSFEFLKGRMMHLVEGFLPRDAAHPTFSSYIKSSHFQTTSCELCNARSGYDFFLTFCTHSSMEAVAVPARLAGHRGRNNVGLRDHAERCRYQRQNLWNHNWWLLVLWYCGFEWCRFNRPSISARNTLWLELFLLLHIPAPSWPLFWLLVGDGDLSVQCSNEWGCTCKLVCVVVSPNNPDYSGWAHCPRLQSAHVAALPTNASAPIGT